MTVAKQINREEVRQLLEAGAQIVEVLPAPEYEEEHLPGAINIPLKQLNVVTKSDGRLIGILYRQDGDEQSEE